MRPPLLNKRIFNNKSISTFPKILPLGLGPFLIGLGEGPLGELMLMEMSVVVDAGTVVCGEEAASGLLEGEPVLSVEPTVLIKRKRDKKIFNFSVSFLSN